MGENDSKIDYEFVRSEYPIDNDNFQWTVYARNTTSTPIWNVYEIFFDWQRHPNSITSSSLHFTYNSSTGWDVHNGLLHTNCKNMTFTFEPGVIYTLFYILDSQSQFILHTNPTPQSSYYTVPHLVIENRVIKSGDSIRDHFQNRYQNASNSGYVVDLDNPDVPWWGYQGISINPDRDQFITILDMTFENINIHEQSFELHYNGSRLNYVEKKSHAHAGDDKVYTLNPLSHNDTLNSKINNYNKNGRQYGNSNIIKEDTFYVVSYDDDIYNIAHSQLEGYKLRFKNDSLYPNQWGNQFTIDLSPQTNQNTTHIIQTVNINNNDLRNYYKPILFNNTADMTTQLIIETPCKLHFDYRIYGTTYGKLSVLQTYHNSTTTFETEMINTMDNDDDNGWLSSSIDLNIGYINITFRSTKNMSSTDFHVELNSIRIE